MDSGASLNVREDNGKTALGLALYHGYSTIAQALRAAGDDKSTKVFSAHDHKHFWKKIIVLLLYIEFILIK